MSKFYQKALIATSLVALAFTCFHTLSENHSSAVLDEPVSIVITKKKKKTEADRALFAEERAKFEFDMLKDPITGKIPDRIKEQVKKQALRAPELSPIAKGAGFTVTPRGPDNFGGRTRAIEIDRSDATNQTILAGGVSSGVFRTTNGGGSWTKVSANDEIHNVTAIVQDPRPGIDGSTLNPYQDVWYYGTGEALGNSSSLGAFIVGYGIWKSTDKGLTWNRLVNSTTGSLEGFQCADLIFRMAVDPTNGNVYAAIPGAVIRSTDGGASWASVFGFSCSNSGNGETDIVISSTGTIYVGMAGDAGSAFDGIWTSATGASGSFTRIAGNSSPGGWRAPGNYDRIVLALAPSDENILYALFENNVSSNCGGTAAPEADLWKYDASGPSWTDLSANMPDEAGCSNGNDPFAVQGGYDLCIAVKPNDPNTVFIGGTNVYRSTDGFSTTANTTRIGGYASTANYALYANHHPDIHFLTFAPGDNNNMYTGTDGGVHRGDITASTVVWSSLNNNYVTYQYYHTTIDPVAGSNTLLGGAQDNGTTETTATQTHSQVWGGDGVAVGIAADGTQYFGSQKGNLHRKSGSTDFITPSGSKSIFVTYFLLDPDNTEFLYYAGNDTLYRTTSASTVNTGTWDMMTGVSAVSGSIGGNIRAMVSSRGGGYAASDVNRKLYIGTDNGEIWRLNDPAFTATGTNPIEITPPSAGAGIVSSISVNPADDNEILVTYSNYNTISVYHTTNAHSNNPAWAEVEGNISLSSFRSSAIVNSGGVKYFMVGTSVGLYCTQTLSGNTTAWSRVGVNDIGYALVSQLAYRPTDNFIGVGTHGNGMFMVEPPKTPAISFASVSSNRVENTANTIDCRNFEDISIPMNIAVAPTGAATVTISNSGTATEGVDFDILNTNKELNFPDGSTSPQNVNIRIYDDSNPESDETVILDFVVSGTSNAVKASFNTTHTLTLSDNDFAPGSTATVWQEDFESGVTFGGFASTDWVSGGFGSPSFVSVWRVGANGGMSGSGSAYVSSTGGASAEYDANAAEDLLLRTEEIDGTTFSNMTLSFDYKVEGVSGSDYGQVLYSPDGSSFSILDGNSSTPYSNTATSTNRTIALPAALDNQTFYLGFRWINDNDGSGTNPPFTVDNLMVTAPVSPAVETVLNSTDEQYFGAFETVHFYSGSNLILTLKNNSAYDYGCTTVTIDREGQGAESAWTTTTGEELASKTFLVTPTNNSPPPAATYDLTMYYSQAEFNGWVSNSNPAHTTADFKIVKSSGAIKDLSPGSTNASVNAATSYAAYGSDHSFTATFDGGFSGFGGGNPSNPVFPVEYSEFTGKQAGAEVQLDWSTSLELNSEKFEIQRSVDGRVFQAIGEVASTGGLSGAQYRFYDINPQSGTNTYRLRQVDLDGRFSFSSTIEVSFQVSVMHSIYPNPFQESFHFTISEEGSQVYEFVLYDLSGKEVHREIARFSDKYSKEVKVKDLPPGPYLYFIRKEGAAVSGKIIKF